MGIIIKEIDGFSAEELQALKKFKSEGRKLAAVFCRFFPSSLLSGLGLWPVRLLTGTTGEAETSGEQLVRPDVCPYCKSTIGNFLEKKSMHRYVDLILGLITCDQIRRTLERLSTDLSLPVFPVQLPATSSEESLHYYTHGVQTAVSNIASYLGKEPDFNIIRSEEQYRVESAEILARLIRKSRTSPLIIHKLLQLFTWTRPEKYLTFIKNVVSQLPNFKPRFTVLLIGSVLCEEDNTVIKVLTEKNVYPIPLNCTGLNMLEGLESIHTVADEEVIATLSRIVFKMPACIRTRPNKKVYDRIGEILEKSKAKGIILKTLSFCDLWYTEKERMKKTFNVPVLVLDTGYGEGENARITTRLESFLETLS